MNARTRANVSIREPVMSFASKFATQPAPNQDSRLAADPAVLHQPSARRNKTTTIVCREGDNGMVK